MSVFALAGRDWQREFPYEREILLPEAAAGKLVALELTGEILEKLPAGNFLRILDEEGKSVPFVWKERAAAPGKRFDSPLAGKIRKMEKLPHGALSLYVEGGDGEEEGIAFSGVAIRTGARNFSRSLKIYLVRKDGKEKLLHKGEFFDHSPRVALQKKEWKWKALEKGKGVRIVIENYASRESSPYSREVEDGAKTKKERVFFRKEIPIEGVTLYQEKVGEKTIFRKRSLKVAVKEEEGVTKLTFSTLGNALSLLRLHSETPYFARDFKLYGIKGKEKYLLAQGRFRKNPPGKKEKDLLTLSVALSRYPLYLLEICHKDAPSLREVKLEAESPLVYLLFPAGEGKRFSLHYGASAGKEIPYPRYDLAEILPSVFWKDLPKGKFGPERANELFRKSRSLPAGKFLFYGILLLGVLLGGGLLWKNGKKIL